MCQDDDGSWRVSGRLPADEGALLNHAIKTARDDLFRQARSELPEDAPAPKVTLVDGLLALAEASLAAGQAARPTSDRYRIYAHLQAGPNPGAANVLSWHLGPVLPDHLRHLHTCDATISAVHEHNGTPINLGREVHIVPRRIRRLIEHRDGGCQVPGCRRRHSLDIHHIIHWEHGGPTDTHNLVTLCRTHHRLHHLGGLQIWGDANRPGQPGGICFADKWGHPLQPASTPKPPDLTSGHSAAATTRGINTNPYTPPIGERLDPTAIYCCQDRNWTPPPPPPTPARTPTPTKTPASSRPPSPTATPPSPSPPTGSHPQRSAPLEQSAQHDPETGRDESAGRDENTGRDHGSEARPVPATAHEQEDSRDPAGTDPSRPGRGAQPGTTRVDGHCTEAA